MLIQIWEDRHHAVHIAGDICMVGGEIDSPLAKFPGCSWSNTESNCLLGQIPFSQSSVYPPKLPHTHIYIYTYTYIYICIYIYMYIYIYIIIYRCILCRKSHQHLDQCRAPQLSWPNLHRDSFPNISHHSSLVVRLFRLAKTITITAEIGPSNHRLV